MTMGPEPMTRTWRRSSRLGMEQLHALLAVRLDKLDEPVEEIVRVVRSGRRLRVVLHRERGYVQAAQPFHHAVAEADVAGLDPAGLGVHLPVQRGPPGEP